MLWWKTFHIVFVVSWFAGMFYLPRIFVYHAQSNDKNTVETFKVMERKLYFGISTPSAVFTLITGSILWLEYGFSGSWLSYKILLVAFLVLYHILCFKYLVDFKRDNNTKSHTYYRFFNEVPVLFLVAIVALVVIKPF